MAMGWPRPKCTNDEANLFFFKYIKKSHCIYNFYIKKQQKNKKTKKQKQNKMAKMTNQMKRFTFLSKYLQNMCHELNWVHTKKINNVS